MNKSQQIYKDTPNLEFSLNWRNWNKDLQDEISLIHEIQTNLLKHWHFRIRKTEQFTPEFELEIKNIHMELISKYQIKYGTYELSEKYFNEHLKNITNERLSMMDNPIM